MLRQSTQRSDLNFLSSVEACMGSERENRDDGSSRLSREAEVQGWEKAGLVEFSSVAQSCPTLCDPMDCSTPGLPVHHQLPELTEPMSIELVMPSNHLIFCHPLHLLPSIFPSIRVFSNQLVLRMRWPKYWSFRNTVLVSAIYQHELAIGIHMPPPS